MPRIRWSGLPPALRDHLFERLRERKITAEDLYQLKAWRESNPDAPDGLWYKDCRFSMRRALEQYSEQFFAKHRVSPLSEHQITPGSHPSYRHEEPASPTTCVTLLTGGLGRSRPVPYVLTHWTTCQYTDLYAQQH